VDIQQLITQASETMLTSGSVMPLIQLELSGNSELPSGRVIIMALDILSDEQSIPVQCGILARLGLETCREYPGEKPIASSFYSEAWSASEPEDDAQGDQSHQTIGAEILDQTDDVADDCSEEGQARPDEQSSHDCQTQQHQTDVCETADPRLDSCNRVHPVSS